MFNLGIALGIIIGIVIGALLTISYLTWTGTEIKWEKK